MSRAETRVSILNVGRFLKTLLLPDTTQEVSEGESRDVQLEASTGMAVPDTREIVTPSQLTQIVVACDAGMGSSIIGAEMLRKQLQRAGLNIKVSNGSLDSLDDTTQVVVTHRELTPRALKQLPEAVHFSLTGFLDEDAYGCLVKRLRSGHLPQGCEFRLLPRVEQITVACDSGIGSSAIGAEILRKQIHRAGKDITVNSSTINDLDEHTQVVITHRELLQRAGKQAPQAVRFALTNFLDSDSYDQILGLLSLGVVPISSQIRSLARVRQIVVACDAGMGTSAIGAEMLRKKLAQAKLAIEVNNGTINNLDADTQAVITHKALTTRAMKQAPNAIHFSLSNFLDGQFYDQIIAQLQAATGTPSSSVDPGATRPVAGFMLDDKDIRLGLTADNKETAIRTAGELLVTRGYVEPDYVNTMLERDTLVSTYLGDGVAVPHGTDDAKELVRRTGIVVCQYPDGVPYGDCGEESAQLVIGIAAKDNEHLDILTNLTRLLDNPDIRRTLATTDDTAYLRDLLAGNQHRS